MFRRGFPILFGCACVLVIALLAIPACVWGQDASLGAIRATVSDSTGARIPMASVVIVNSATGLRYSAVSDAEGRCVIDLLPPGNYSARASAPGMSPQVASLVRVALGVATQVNFQLKIAGQTEIVNVSSEPQEVQPDSTAVSSLIDEREIQELPLNGRRYTDLALLTPGVTQDPRGLTSSSNGDLSFGGIRGFQSSYLVDGEDNNNAFFSQARGRYRAPYQFSSEVVQEFRISSNTYGAELGRAGGAVVNVVTKSGSNHFHGTGFEYFRNSMFDAKQRFIDAKPKDQQQQFGFTFGGPLKRNRAFFFVGYDAQIFHVPTVVQFDDGDSVVVPQPGTGPVTPGDYEASDQSQVFAAAAQLSKQAGQYPSRLLGNASFAKLDVALTPRNQLSLRLNTSRYYGSNNVFIDPASPLTTYGISDNGEEQVWTESGALSLTSGLSFHLLSHFRAQFSRDLQQSSSNSTDPLTRIYSVLDGMGRSNILPRQTREHRLHLAETLSWDTGRHSLKLGGDALLTWIYNFFPSNFGGEYIFSPIKVNPFTFAPQIGGLELTPLRAYAHEVPHYYIQNFGQAVTHPDTNEYSAFAQDTIRVTNHLALSLGVRYDLQTFSKKGLLTNPLWPDSGKVPYQPYNFAPRAGLAYSLGKDRPLIIRAGYGLFYTRIPQIYTSTIENENGLSRNSIFLNNTNYYDNQIFPQYPNPLVSCAPLASSCAPPASLLQYAESDLSSFSHNFRTPEVHQASLSLEHQFGGRLAGGLSYTFVHGQDLIRARDANLPPPVNVSYPVYDPSGLNLLGYDTVSSFSTWQLTRSLTCPYPPCINPLARPIPQLGSVNVFESAASSVYHGLTVSLRKRMSHGVYFRLGYTWAHAEDDGQDALVAGQPATVQNSYSPNSEKGPSVTDQRHRFVFSWIAEPRPFDRSEPALSAIFNGWKMSGVITVGSGRPVDARVTGDANQDDNSSNDRLPGASRNSFVGPGYASGDMRLSRQIVSTDRLKLTLTLEAFNLLNHTNLKMQNTQDGFQNTAAQFLLLDKTIDFNYFPAYFQKTTNFLKPADAYASRQLQLGIRAAF
jgi:Carboxypeptidase regulatory-like domain/TonB dependent receptor-like, beta-barrel